MKKKLENKGFSLIEILVSMAVISIICVSLYAGFGLSARLNYQADNTSKLTSYAQTELEKVQSMRVADYVTLITEKKAGGSCEEITEGGIYERALAAKQEFIAAQGADKLPQKELQKLFTPFVCRQEDLRIGKEDYTLQVIFEPAVYSGESQVNVSPMAEISQADGKRYPIISKEINQYEGLQTEGAVTASAVILNIRDRLEAMGSSVSTGKISAGLVKTVDVAITTQEDTVRVVCNLTYQYDSITLQYQVYQSEYSYTTMKKKADDTAKVFLFARAFQDTSAYPTEGAHCRNILRITQQGDLTVPVEVYFARGYLEGPQAVTDYNFDEVWVNGSNYFDTAMEGSMPFGTGSFYTNIKNKTWNLSSEPDERQNEAVLGEKAYDTYCYQVTVQLLDSSKAVAASVASAKIER